MSTAQRNITNALSFDIEDWFHLIDIPAVADPSTWERAPTLVEPNTHLILELLAQAEVRATFFVLGWVAERHPRLVPQIAAAGHEIAAHSFWHGRVDLLSRPAFREDVSRTVKLLEDQAGTKVLGYRAPSFSITPGSEWALDELLDLGIAYDASLFPAPRGHGGYPCRQEPHAFDATPSGRAIPELPMSVVHWGGLKVPFSGGGYLRLFPEFLIRAGFRHFHRRGLPVVVYLHPRDFAVDCPRVPMPFSRRFRCYVGLKTTRPKLEMMLRSYRFDTCAAVMGLTAAPLTTSR
jgi:polysaccharide deacetylase family protein (PEP-CTERM system associated)